MKRDFILEGGETLILHWEKERLFPFASASHRSRGIIMEALRVNLKKYVKFLDKERSKIPDGFRYAPLHNQESRANLEREERGRRGVGETPTLYVVSGFCSASPLLFLSLPFHLATSILNHLHCRMHLPTLQLSFSVRPSPCQISAIWFHQKWLFVTILLLRSAWLDSDAK